MASLLRKSQRGLCSAINVTDYHIVEIPTAIMYCTANAQRDRVYSQVDHGICAVVSLWPLTQAAQMYS